MTPQLVESIKRIARNRRFKRKDVLGGEDLCRQEWARAAQDYLELRKVYSMDQYISHRMDGMSSRQAYLEAAKTAISCRAGARRAHNIGELAGQETH